MASSLGSSHPLWNGSRPVHSTTPSPPSTTLRGAGQGHRDKVLEADLDDALLLVVALPKGLGEALHLHTRHDELVHGDLALVLGVALAHQESHKVRREPEAHLLERLAQLGLVDVAGPVPVVRLERRQPLVDIGVQLVELGQVYRAALVRVEHADHQLARLIGEVLPPAIHQRRLELLRIDLAAAVTVHLREDPLHLGTHSGRHWRIATAKATARGTIAASLRLTIAPWLAITTWGTTRSTVPLEEMNYYYCKQKFTSITDQRMPWIYISAQIDCVIKAYPIYLSSSNFIYVLSRYHNDNNDIGGSE